MTKPWIPPHARAEVDVARVWEATFERLSRAVGAGVTEEVRRRAEHLVGLGTPRLPALGQVLGMLGRHLMDTGATVLNRSARIEEARPR